MTAVAGTTATVDWNALGQMPAWLLALQVAAGIPAGAGVAWLYFIVLRRQAAALASGQLGIVGIGGYFIRLVLVGGGVGLTTWWSVPAGIGCAVTFIVAQRIVIRAVKKQHERETQSDPDDTGDEAEE